MKPINQCKTEKEVLEYHEHHNKKIDEETMLLLDFQIDKKIKLRDKCGVQLRKIKI